MPINYENLELLYEDSFNNFDQWYHEGVGEIKKAPNGGMRLHCFGSRQGGPACMGFFRPTLPDQITVEYDVVIRSQGGLLINYIAMRGLNREDPVEDIDILPERTGIMANYYDRKYGLQSYHVSISRFNDKGEHTGTSNWRRNPGSLLIGHGLDPCKELNKRYHIRLTKDEGACQCYVDKTYAHGFIDRDMLRLPVPDYGKFVFRVIGSDVMVDINNFKVFKVAPAQETRTFTGLY